MMPETIHLLPRSERVRGMIPNGHWSLTIIDGRRSAVISCPKCGKVSHILDTDIEFDGMITSVWRCVFDCGFQQSVKLLDW